MTGCTAASGRHTATQSRSGTFAWWCREGRLCAEDGRWGAAAAAYTEAVRHPHTAAEGAAAAVLLEQAAGQWRRDAG